MGPSVSVFFGSCPGFGGNRATPIGKGVLIRVYGSRRCDSRRGSPFRGCTPLPSSDRLKLRVRQLDYVTPRTLHYVKCCEGLTGARDVGGRCPRIVYYAH